MLTDLNRGERAYVNRYEECVETGERGTPSKREEAKLVRR